MEIVNLTLPNLPAHIISKLKVFADTLAHNDEERIHLNNFYGGSINTVNHSFVPVHELNAEINDIYSSYFGDTFDTYIGVLRNVNNIPASMPAHYDYYRHIAINYYIDLGGNNVTTCFYDKSRNTDMEDSKFFTPNEINLQKSYYLQVNNWYSYSVQQCHSVENIETTRIMLILVLQSNPTMQEFIQRHKILINPTSISCL